MATKQSRKEPKKEFYSLGARVTTPDGNGKTIGMNMRKNTNGGPGVRQYIVQLDNGRIRHYSTGNVKLKSND